jgi:putative PIN family toxin of toxin-antitoxin system
MRVVVDTNVLVSALLWQGTPGRLIELAADTQIELFTSRALIDELSEVLHRKKLAKQVKATGLTSAQMVRHYSGRLARIVTARKLVNPVSRDADDDAVLACALTASANMIVSGDDDLLALKHYRDIPIVTPAQAIQRIEAD